ncbi:MAG: hypothetical protein K2K40_05835 [Paramuribaculum sp.]|nr:hypothetical protein [Candidatus Amulumruptor sp.]MDE6546173.1 hypothetical protein [Paramuribaculum sp.]MDE6587839.1 hypothetical protein [Paramuribaculum sp.]MDE7152296.1 hypothetical protein [Candidatus Amulumruptor sp.]MDE7236702.1 hypothetical protein [Paramuribaculum sp.]
MGLRLPQGAPTAIERRAIIAVCATVVIAVGAIAWWRGHLAPPASTAASQRVVAEEIRAMQQADSLREAQNDSIKRERRTRKRTKRAAVQAAPTATPRNILDESIPSNTESK